MAASGQSSFGNLEDEAAAAETPLALQAECVGQDANAAECWRRVGAVSVNVYHGSLERMGAVASDWH